MPTPSIMEIPKSRSAEEFECLCTDILTETYHQRFMRYGRNGQKQNGIDIRTSSNNECYVVAQCKNYFMPKSSNNIVKQIEKDIKSAESAGFQISKFIAMTALNRDMRIQDNVMNINSTIAIELWFWDEIQEKICNNSELLKKYYPQFFENTEISIMESNEMISALISLKDAALNFHDKYKNYRVAYHVQNDIALYNQCVAMFITATRLHELKNHRHLQLQKISIVDVIEKIIKTIPDFHDENQDGTGATMIYTLGNFLDYFSFGKDADENTIKFVKQCNKAIKKLTRF